MAMSKAPTHIEKPEDVFISLDDNEKGKKRLSVERIYQRKTQLEHILLRPDTYVGSVEETKEPMYVYDEEKDAIIKRMVTFVPGLYKIFDEILVNAADNKQRDPLMNAMKITIKPEDNTISVWNNGRGIPVEMHSVEKKYVPELIFGTLLTSSNYNDSQKKVTGGRNGYGAKLCNIFSSEFTVETSCSESKKYFKMTWSNNMGKSGKTIIKESKNDFTRVTFKPDLSKFGMTHLTKDMVDIMTRRVYDMAGCTKGVAVYLNAKKLAIKNFKEYVEMYVRGIAPSDDDDDEELTRKVVHEVVNPRWEVAITASTGAFQQASFVNSIATTKGGTHVNYIVDQVVAKLLEAAKKKNKGGMDLKPMHIKSQMWVFVNCLVENPSFDSQTKENMTLKARSFGSTCSLGDKFIKAATSCGVVERVLNWARAKSQAQIAKKQSGSKHSKLRGIPKLDDANDAGSKNSLDCTLIVTEGDSAKSLAVSGLGVIGRDHYGVFPLRGKLLNVREATHNQIMNNEEIKNLVKILGLQYTKKYQDMTELKTLRYGHLMIMADQDQDGSHIKGLVINFIHHNWPKLIRQNFVEEFITPIVKVSKGRQELAFYSLPEFERWKAETENHHTWKIKYYKGLGTSTAKEAKEYFSDMEKHRIPFKYGGPDDDDAINLAFSKKLTDRRKEWLTAWLQEKKEKRQEGLNESFLYGEQTSQISYSDFINKELILFSNADNERSIPSMVDGLKPGQRKVLFTCFKRKDKKEIKVAQLAGSVAEHSAYHHGEASLMSTIINLAQNFVGSNNINLLQPIGQFGTRLHGGKDAASPRYIFTMLSPLARLIFPPTDDTQLTFLNEDNSRIEPEWYCPIIPMILVNGSEGIGTGYSTFVPNYNVREIVGNIKRLLNDMEPLEMKPHYKNFTGLIAHVEPTKYMVYGNIARLASTSVEITELPIRSWTQNYKEGTLETMLQGTEKVQPSITDYKEYHTDTTVRFVVNLSADKMNQAEKVRFHKKFKLESSLSIANMVLFDKDGCLRRYSSAEEILKDFYALRLDMYKKRKDYLEGMLSAEAAKLTNQARFIVEKIEGKIVVENKKKAVIIAELKAKGYRSDPVKAWKATLSSVVEENGSDKEEDASGEGSKDKDDFNYLMSISMWSLSWESKEEILRNRDAKVEELMILQEKTPKCLWKEDLEQFMTELDRVEEMERNEEAAGAMISIKKPKSKGKTLGRQTKLLGAGKNSLKQTKPSPFAETVNPVIPEFNANPKKPGTKKLKNDDKVSNTKDKAREKAEKIEAAKLISDSFNFSDDNDDDAVAEMDLVSRLASKKTKEKTSKPTGAKPKQQAKISFKPKPKKVDEEVEEDDDLSFGTPSPKPKRSVRAKPAMTYAISSDEDEGNEFFQIEESESDSLQIYESDSEDDDFMPDPKRHKKANAKISDLKPIRAKKVLSKPKIPVSKPSAAAKVKNGDSNDEIIKSVHRAQKGAKKKAAILDDTLTDDNDDDKVVKSRQKISSSDEDDYTYEPSVSSKSIAKHGTSKKPLEKPKPTAKKTKMAGQSTLKVLKTSSDAQTKGKPKKRPLDVVSGEDDENEGPKTKKTVKPRKPVPKKKKGSKDLGDDESEDKDDDDWEPGHRPSRKAQAKYRFDVEEVEDDSDEDYKCRSTS